MFANIGNLIKKLLSLFIVGADNSIKAIKELYCVGEDGKIHKIPIESGEKVEAWRAVLTTASYHYGTGGAYGGHVTNTNEPYVYSNNGGRALIIYTVTVPSGYTNPLGNGNWNLTAKLRVANASIKTTKSYALLQNNSVETQVTDGTTEVNITRTSTDGTFSIGVCAYARNSPSGISQAWLSDVKVNGIPVEFYESL